MCEGPGQLTGALVVTGRLAANCVTQDAEGTVRSGPMGAGESQIAVEATYGWEWLAELLEDTAITSISPTRCARSPQPWVRTDAVDAKTLAPAAHRPVARAISRSPRSA